MTIEGGGKPFIIPRGEELFGLFEPYHGFMKRPFAATAWREGDWHVSQYIEVDVASEGQTEEEALANLKEALELHFEAPQATRPAKVRMIEVEVGAA